MSLKERIQQVEERVQAACNRSGRRREDVHIIAVTKYVSPEMTGQVLDEGIVHLGENRPQTALLKQEMIGDQGIWHFIGHIQRRKAKDIVGKFQYIHSLDRYSLALELDKRATEANLEAVAFLQVNVSGEQSKQGISAEEVEQFLLDTASLSHLKIVGLMTMAPIVDDPELARPIFRKLRELRDEINAKGITAEPLTELSMGMSEDYEVAIEEGATWVRLGTILMGKGE